MQRFALDELNPFFETGPFLVEHSNGSLILYVLDSNEIYIRLGEYETFAPLISTILDTEYGKKLDIRDITTMITNINVCLNRFR